MIDQAFTREVRDFAKTQLGVDLFGVAGVDRFADAPAGHQPGELLPGAKSVIVMAGRMLDSTFLSSNPRVYVLRYSQLRLHYQDIGYEMCRFLEDRDQLAINFPSTAPQDSGPVGKLLFADFSHRHAAELAGLGQIGRNHLLVTPQFGPRVWLMSVITTAELESDPILTQDVCPGEECNICVDACPEKAFSPEGHIKDKCLQGYGRFGLLGILRLVRDALQETDPQKRAEMIFGPRAWTLWMVLQYQGGPSMCNACIASCPVGWKASAKPRISLSAETPTVPLNEFDPEKLGDLKNYMA